MIKSTEIILYVVDQNKSKEFYTGVLNQQPSLDVEGMTEFELGNNLKLGLMPDKNIAKIIWPKTPHPELGRGIPRCELYLLVDSIEEYVQRAKKSGALMVSETEKRNWGHTVCYMADPDGHVIAFAIEN